MEKAQGTFWNQAKHSFVGVMNLSSPQSSIKKARAQGAIEYLLIIAAAVLVVSIVIIAVTGALGGGQNQTDASITSQGNSFSKLALTNIEDNMVLYWKLNDGTVNDYFEINNGSTSNVDLGVQGKYGKGAKLSGPNSYLILSRGIAIGNNVTYGGWVKFDNFDCPDNYCVFVEQDGADEDSYQIYTDATNFRGATSSESKVYCWDGDVDNYSASIMGEGYLVSAEVWHNILCVHNGEEMCVWVDGKKGDCWDTSKEVNSNVHFGVGGLKEMSEYWMQGTVDEIMVWNRTLKDSELKALFEIGAEIR
ncbi:MAG: hypothetical protein HON47_01380 [Candidatus Diapherotrites archaeon]|jgi:uncharacterized protein (UPF0333 family)|uniref:LamG domain-containing protein n=1 Tax=Candidatus Iainarchaeum sp. TaxID=3101447 RepID=A0A8T5GET6_9ARCH|nr:hypothetical protein [Candidatus Diapherotrites archaeon]MBT7241441.1 hypothetical protein [Candidatus Diapherotrites archaeon]